MAKDVPVPGSPVNPARGPQAHPDGHRRGGHLAALGIPEVMGYTSIAGMPVITGLYTILVPIAVFAVLGSSRHLVVGADSATAAIMAAGLAGWPPTASPEYVTLAGMLALVTGGFLILARLRCWASSRTSSRAACSSAS